MANVPESKVSNAQDDTSIERQPAPSEEEAPAGEEDPPVGGRAHIPPDELNTAGSSSYSYSYETNGSYSYEASYSYECCDKPPSPPGQVVEVELADGGTLAGRRLRQADIFLGVPFAEAPLGNLRWAPPRRISGGWNGILEATSFSARCQPLIQEATCLGYSRAEGGCAGNSEDCLSLNLFTPVAASQAVPSHARRGKAIMFWIHGGCYGYGSASDPEYDGSLYAASHDVIVVTVNYRLGALGWLGHDALRSRDPLHGSTGNYGLLDNIEALRWVQRNGAAFGGDPARVTIFGESSGAGSVSQLLGVEASWGLYHQAILQPLLPTYC